MALYSEFEGRKTLWRGVEHMSTVDKVPQTDHVVSFLPNGTGFCSIGLRQIKRPEVS
jgi:hypothetical protein